MADKVATTLNIDREVKTDFKIECVKNQVEMGETVEQMMKDYVNASRKMHEANEQKAKERKGDI